MLLEAERGLVEARNTAVEQLQSNNQVERRHDKVFAFGENSLVLRLESELSDLRTAKPNLQLLLRNNQVERRHLDHAKGEA